MKSDTVMSPLREQADDFENYGYNFENTEELHLQTNSENSDEPSLQRAQEDGMITSKYKVRSRMSAFSKQALDLEDMDGS